MKVFHGRNPGTASEQRTTNFTGAVWADPLIPTTDGVTVNNVFFTPGARTYWHSHAQGQVLQVISGSGFICVDGGVPQVIRTGDLVWIGPNERHWHGASPTSFMSHTATSIGKATWQEEVPQADYLGQR